MNAEQKITAQRGGSLNDSDRLKLAELLIKAGYTVRIGKEKKDGKQTSVTYVAYRAE